MPYRGRIDKSFGDVMVREVSSEATLRMKADSNCIKKYGRGNYGYPQIVKETERIVNG